MESEEGDLKDISSFIRYFGLIMPRVFAVISISATSIGIFVICFKSPKSMASYKYVLLIMMMVSFQFDMVLSVLAGPIPLPGANGLQLIGFFAELFPTQGNMLLFMIIVTFYLEILVIFLGFLYREYVLLRVNEQRKENVLRFLPVIPFVFFGYVVTPIIFSQIVTSDQLAREYVVKELKQKLFKGAALFLLHPDRDHIMLLLSSSALIMVFTVGFFIQKSISKINNYLTENSIALSSRSIRLQKMLLRALIFQTVIPFMFLIFPCIILYAVVFVAPSVATVPNDFAQQMTAVVFSTPAFYSPARISCMIYFTTPYKEYVMKLMCMKPEAGPIVTITSVVAPSMHLHYSYDDE